MSTLVLTLDLPYFTYEYFHVLQNHNASADGVNLTLF